ncbi:hypothetical protein SUGI_1007250 [Cryptomeria japonica]|nr:hypothetical protein SUGI_1007250 [Cryptomeria japonica]
MLSSERVRRGTTRVSTRDAEESEDADGDSSADLPLCSLPFFGGILTMYSLLGPGCCVVSWGSTCSRRYAVDAMFGATFVVRRIGVVLLLRMDICDIYAWEQI